MSSNKTKIPEAEGEQNLNLEERLKTLFLLPSPYEIKKGIRFLRGTNKLVSESLKILCTDTRLSVNNNKIFSSISECSSALHLDRSKIKNCLLTGELYNNYKFKYFF